MGFTALEQAIQVHRHVRTMEVAQPDMKDPRMKPATVIGRQRHSVTNGGKVILRE
jgi:hypothetical protein